MNIITSYDTDNDFRPNTRSRSLLKSKMLQKQKTKGNKKVKTTILPKLEMIRNSEECFICWEYIKNNNETPIKLQNQTIYFNTCECDGLIHTSCLEYWYTTRNICPICRNIMIINNNEFMGYSVYKQKYIIKCCVFLKRNYMFILRFLFVLLFSIRVSSYIKNIYHKKYDVIDKNNYGYCDIHENNTNDINKNDYQLKW